MRRKFVAALAVALTCVMTASSLPGQMVRAEEISMEDISEEETPESEQSREELPENGESGEKELPESEQLEEKELLGDEKSNEDTLTGNQNPDEKESERGTPEKTLRKAAVSTLASQPSERAGSPYKVSNERQFENAIDEIEDGAEKEAVIILASDYTGTAPSLGHGAAGKHITLQSEGEDVKPVRLTNGGYLSGDVTFDNVQINFRGTTSPEFYANGHLFETTLRTTTEFEYASTALILYGGAEDTDVTGDTNLILRSGMYKEVYGGGYNGSVNGNVNLTIGSQVGEPAEALKIQSAFGGGYAKKNPAKVSGDVNLNVYSGSVSNYLYGGGRTAGKKAEDTDRDAAAVAGTVNLNIGYEGINEGKISIQTVYAGSYNSSVNAVKLHTYTSGSFYGGGNCDTVYDSISIIAEGQGTKAANIRGAGTVTYPENNNSGPVRVGSRHTADTPVIQTQYAYETSDTKTLASVYTDAGVQTEIYGDVKTEIPADANVKLRMLSVGTSANTSTLDIRGKSELVINGTVNAGFVQGDRAETDSNKELAESTVTVADRAVLSTGVFQDWGTVILEGGSDTKVDSINFTSAFPGSNETSGNVPFDNVYNLNLRDNAKLDTRNIASSLLGNADLGDALWIMRGRMTIEGDLEMNQTDLQIPAVVPGQNYGARNRNIALKANGTGSGTCNVTLMDKDTWTEAVPTVGDNYILLNKDNAPSQKSILLVNTNKGKKYFARVDDARGGNYYMWQVAEPAEFIYIRPEDQTIYTGGEDGSVDNAEFPHPIYLDDAKGTEIADNLTFKVDGTEWNDPDNEYPFTVKYYEKKSDGTAGAEITNDEHYGDFIAKIVPVDSVDADEITLADDTKVSFEDGTLRIRYVSSFTEASGNELTVEAVIYDPDDAASKAQAQKQAEELAVQEEAVTAILPEDTDILLNGKSAYVYPDSAQDQISLLCDELLPVSAGADNSQREEMLLDKAQDEGFDTDGYESTFRYLDLVDENNSNAWVASTKGTDVFWAYPEGRDKDSDIQLLHFTGLHREYQMNGQSLADQVAASEVEEVSFEKTEAGIWFHIDQSGFSPFLLNWEKEDVEAGETEKPDIDKPNTDEPDTEAPDTEVPDVEAADTDRADEDQSGNGGSGESDGGQVGNRNAGSTSADADWEAPQTGVDERLVLPAVAALFSAACAGTVIYRRKRTK